MTESMIDITKTETDGQGVAQNRQTKKEKE
jgi:hypothetical protein